MGQVGSSAVLMPGKQAHASAYAIRIYKTLCKQRSAIKAMIGHLKSEHRLGRHGVQLDAATQRIGR